MEKKNKTKQNKTKNKNQISFNKDMCNILNSCELSLVMQVVHHFRCCLSLLKWQLSEIWWMNAHWKSKTVKAVHQKISWKWNKNSTKNMLKKQRKNINKIQASYLASLQNTFGFLWGHTEGSSGTSGRWGLQVAFEGNNFYIFIFNLGEVLNKSKIQLLNTT